MSALYAYICTRTTTDPFVPSMSADIANLSRDVSVAFSAIAGGFSQVGQIALFPVQRSVPNHLLCDGREVEKEDFPELYEYLTDSQGTAVDPGNFVLPNFIGTPLDTAATAAPESTSGGTVSMDPPMTGGSEGNTYGDVSSGGRPLR